MDEKGFDGINVIPFIDIMLVLLTIVLTTATFIANGTIPVNLPKAESSDAAGRGVTVEINQGGFQNFQELSEQVDSKPDTLCLP